MAFNLDDINHTLMLKGFDPISKREFEVYQGLDKILPDQNALDTALVDITEHLTSCSIYLTRMDNELMKLGCDPMTLEERQASRAYRTRLIETGLPPDDRSEAWNIMDRRRTLLSRRATIDNFFSYHPPVGDEAQRYEQIRSMGREFAHLIMDLTPGGSDQDQAIKHLRETVMWANASIATGPKKC